MDPIEPISSITLQGCQVQKNLKGQMATLLHLAPHGESKCRGTVSYETKEGELGDFGFLLKVVNLYFIFSTF